jgi:trigger factor
MQGGNTTMSFTVEQLEEKNMVKLVIESSAEDFEKGIEKAYNKNKNRITVQGFRKGKAPRKIIEKFYGREIFFEDAANAIIPDAYAAAAEESQLDIVSQPQIDLVQLESGKPFVFSATVAVRPEVGLGSYKGVEVAKVKTEATDDDINAELDRVREQNSRVVSVEGRPVQDKDIAVIDYEGFVDGVPFQGGKAEGHSLTIGSHTFIDNFEEQLIGKNAGDDVEVNVTFPEDYHAEELKGKAATFKVSIKEIKEKQFDDLDDDFAQNVSDFDTLDEYKDDLRKTIGERKAKEAKTKKENEVIEKIIESSSMDIPEAMINTQVRQMADDFSMRLQQQGLSVDQYFQFTGLTPDRLIADMKPEAEKRIKSRLVLDAIVKAENITVSDDEYEAELTKMSEEYKMPLDQIKEFTGEKEKKQIIDDMAVQKAVELIVSEAVEK